MNVFSCDYDINAHQSNPQLYPNVGIQPVCGSLGNYDEARLQSLLNMLQPEHVLDMLQVTPYGTGTIIIQQPIGRSTLQPVSNYPQFVSKDST